MKTFISLVLSAFILVSMTTTVNAQQSQQHNNHGVHHSDNQSTKSDNYVCPMHPEVTGQQGDTCPKCGMTLMPMQAKAESMHQNH